MRLGLVGLLGALTPIVLTTACAAEGDAPTDCIGAKCDTPDGPSENYCPVRKKDALADSTVNFTETALRWECKDVNGVTAEDFGQEYCEFFALVELAGDDPVALGRRLDGTARRTPSQLELSNDQIDDLEQNPSATYGHCVFTSWFQDSGVELSGQVGQVEVSANVFKAKVNVNSRNAAVDLVQQCAVKGKHSAIDSGFERGCAEAAALFDTGWRRSDPTICAASLAMADCDCSGMDAILPSFPGDDAPAWQHAGLPLGSWKGRTDLPPGCRAVASAGSDNIVVACDLSASDILNGSGDMLETCNSLYASRVVVHLPIPEAAIDCDPACVDRPWLIED